MSLVCRKQEKHLRKWLRMVHKQRHLNLKVAWPSKWKKNRFRPLDLKSLVRACKAMWGQSKGGSHEFSVGVWELRKVMCLQIFLNTHLQKDRCCSHIHTVGTCIECLWKYLWEYLKLFHTAAKPSQVFPVSLQNTGLICFSEWVQMPVVVLAHTLAVRHRCVHVHVWSTPIAGRRYVYFFKSVKVILL